MLVITLEDIVLNIILITFPLLIYLVMVCYNEMDQWFKKELLSMCLITSLYLCFRFGISTSSSIILLFCNIPIVIAYMKKNLNLGIILSVIDIAYCYFVFPELFLIITIKFISYIILYLCARKRKLSTGGLILSFAVLQGFFLSLEYFCRVPEVAVSDLFSILALIFVHYFITFSVIYIFKVIEKVETLNNTIELLEKDKIINDALFKLTHEIKNPLAVCKGYLDMIDFDNPVKAQKYILIMKEEINRSLNIVTDFLAFNKIKIKKEELDLSMLLEEVYESLHLITDEKDIKLSYQEEEDEIYIEGDYERLKQVIINLVKNSIEAINKKGKITLSCQREIDYVNIIIEDNGSGMDKETLEKVTEMFYTTKQKGSGLGVSLSNEIIKAHNGTLSYQSILNEGTTATIRLPIK